MSNNIAVFALDLKSAYEGEHRIFGLLILANLPQNEKTYALNYKATMVKTVWY
jgi:hypothetical protein